MNKRDMRYKLAHIMSIAIRTGDQGTVQWGLLKLKETNDLATGRLVTPRRKVDTVVGNNACIIARHMVSGKTLASIALSLTK